MSRDDRPLICLTSRWIWTYILINVTETVRYTYRLRPGRTAEAALLAEWSRCRWLWNEAVHQQRTGRKPTFGKLSKLLTEARAVNAWLRAGSQVAQQQTLRTYGTALDHSFKVKDRGRPKKKRKKDALPSLEYTTRGFSIKGGRLCLPGTVTAPLVWSRDLPVGPEQCPRLPGQPRPLVRLVRGLPRGHLDTRC